MTAATPVKILIPGDDPIQISGSPQLERLRQHGEVLLYSDRPASEDEKVRRAADADVIINSRSSVKWSADTLRRLPKLRMIAVCGIGTDAVDLEVARERKIIVSNIPGRTAPLVAEHALALLLAVSRRLAFQTAELKAGRWTRRDNVYLRGKTLGVIGTGAIGREMIKLAKAIGMEVVAWSFHPSERWAVELGFRNVELPDLLATSDAISLHVRLTDQSRHLIGREQIAQMRPGALLVNTARGAVVETQALVDALHSGHIGGAAIDVFDLEPIPSDHPLLACEQVVLTPHNADQTPEGVEILNAGAVDNVIAFLEGRPQNVVT